MSLRRKDDWDEALEEAHQNSVERGEILPVKTFIPGLDYNYGAGIEISFDEIFGKCNDKAI